MLLVIRRGLLPHPLLPVAKSTSILQAHLAQCYELNNLVFAYAYTAKNMEPYTPSLGTKWS